MVQELACSVSYGINKTVIRCIPPPPQDKPITPSPSGMEPTAHLTQTKESTLPGQKDKQRRTN